MPRLLRPFPTHQDPNELARQWFADALPDEWSDHQRRLFERGLAIAGIDLRNVAVIHFERLERVAPQLDELLKEGGSFAVHHALSAVSLPRVEVIAHIAREWTVLSKKVRLLKSFARLTKILNFPRRIERQVLGQTNRRIAALQATIELGKSLELKIFRRSKQAPQRAVPVLRLAELLIANGYQKRAAFRFTAGFLRQWDPASYSELTLDQVRHRHEHHQKQKAASPQRA
jgi:hypothetical protein